MPLRTLARCIAFYIPAFYAFPENDRWWGSGFTEWDLVKGARPLFPGHEQPRAPHASLGYYDPRDPDVRKRQACLAAEYGIEGFCYWHMWFGEGKMLLHETAEHILKTGVPEMPFCLAWANETWTRRWARSRTRGEVLIEQTYPGEEDHHLHFSYLLPFFRDHRYIQIDGKPLFVIYRPFDIPHREATIKLWQAFARDAGLRGIFFVGMITREREISRLQDLDGYTRKQPPEAFRRYGMGTVQGALRGDILSGLRCAQGLLRRPQVFSQRDFIRYARHRKIAEREFPQILTNWDDTPRQGRLGTVIFGTGSDLLHKTLGHAVRSVQSRPQDRRLIFLKSWNEWGEGNYVEPDDVYGFSLLQTIRDTLISS
jgi:hypothetical protein